MGSAAIPLKPGRPGVHRLVTLLDRIAAECERRAPTVPELGRTGQYARQTQSALAGADLRKEAALTASRHAHAELVACYRDATTALWRLKGQLIALYGVDVEAHAAFGLRAPSTPGRRSQKATGQATEQATDKATETNATASSPVQPQVASAASIATQPGD
jgi:hypothetical protein